MMSKGVFSKLGFLGTKPTKPTKPKLWFDANNKIEKHLLQTTIDTLSYAENLPLRVLDWDALKNIDHTALLKENLATEVALKKIKEYCQFWEKFFRRNGVDNLPPPILITEATTAEWISKQEQKIWLNLPSNPLPIHTLFRLCKEWCWFILIWFIANRDQITEATDEKKPLSAFGMPQWELHFRWINLGVGEKKHLLVIGPIYKSTGKSEAKTFSEGAGQQILECFKYFYTSGCAEKSLTSPISEQHMQRMLLARISLPEQETLARIHKAVEALTAMTNSLELGKDSYIYAGYFAVTRAYISVCRWRSQLWEKKGKACKLYLYFSLPYEEQYFLQLIVELTGNVESKGLKILDGKIVNLLEKDSEKFGNQDFLCAMYLVDKNGEQDSCKEGSLATLNLSVARWEERMASRRRYFQNLSADMLHNWLQDHAGELHYSPENTQGTSEKESLFDHICSTILEDLRGDVCHLYRFEQKNSKVNLLGAAYNTVYGKSDQRKLRQQMETLQEREKNHSAVFRCIDKKTTLYIETPKDSEENPQFLSYSNSGLESKSGILSPIMYQGRIWGVLEVTGLVNYQFSWTHQYALSNIVSILNTHFYEQYLRFALKYLTRLAIQDNPDNSDNPERLSDMLSSIFLCQGAAIWLKSRDEKESYTLYGTNINNYTDGDTDLFKTSMTIRCASDLDKDSLITKLKHEYITSGNCNYLESELSMDSKVNCDDLLGRIYVQSRPHRNKLYKLGLIEVMVFALTKEVDTRSSQGREDSLLGFVTLHHKELWRYEKNWQNIINLVNGQLVAALEMLDALQNKEDDNIALLHHEIKQDANTLSRIPGSVASIMQHLSSWKNNTEKLIREIKLTSPKDKADNLEDNYTKLAGRFYRNTIFLPEITALSKKLASMKQRAILLEEKISLLSYSKRDGVTLKDLFGDNSFDLNLPIEDIDIFELCKDIVSAKNKDVFDKGMFVDYGNIREYSFKNIRIAILNNFIQNVLDNAIKYGDRGTSISIDITNNKSFYCLSFSNEARNLLTFEDKNQLFLKTFRSGRFKKEYPGEGMGLFVVKNICDYLGVDYSVNIKVKNEDRAIYKFEFKIPRRYIILKRIRRY